jgi:23S rRNA pseudouridine2605 synthase
MTDNEKWQDKPVEGENSARRDGEWNKGNSDSENPWKKQNDNRGNYSGSSDRPRRSFSDNNAGNSRSGNSFDRPRSNSSDSGNSFMSHFNNSSRGYGDGRGDRNRRDDSEGGNRFERPRRNFSEGNNDRPVRNFNEGGSDRPRRSFSEGNSDRPRRNFNEGGSDRPGRSFSEGNSDRPRRSFNEGGSDRPGRSFSDGNNDRPRRTFNEGEDRPRRSFSEGNSDRPRRSFTEGNNDRPRRSFNEGEGDRPRRSFSENSFDRPRRSFGENNDFSRRRTSDSGDRYNNSNSGGFDRKRQDYADGGSESDRSQRSVFRGPSLPKPERNDGRPRRPRIKRESGFDHGTPFGRSNQPALDPNVPIRLNKFLANAGICSRREADEYIQAGVVKVNGEVVNELGVKVKPTDNILFHDQLVNIERKVYILLNKPKDCVTTSDDPQERMTVMDLVKGACYERIYPVGRLDRNTTGVLLLTNDGDLASKLTHPKYEKRKIYQVTLDRNLTENDLRTIFEDGVTLDDELVKVDNLSYVDAEKKNVIGIEIHSGQNRVVRRIFESFGYKVFKLDRVYFAGLTKKNLPRGKWRHLTDREVSLLKMGAFV